MWHSLPVLCSLTFMYTTYRTEAGEEGDAAKRAYLGVSKDFGEQNPSQ